MDELPSYIELGCTKTVTEIPASLLVPIGAIVAACITGVISFVGLVISKEQKTSEFRQAWIDALRVELAEFASQARRLANERTPFDLRQFTGSFLEQMEAQKEEILRPDPLLVNRQRFAQTYYALRLRLNPKEVDHQQLLEHFEVIFRILNESGESERPQQIATELDTVARIAQNVLKREWVRVKGGETLYRLALRVAGGLAVILGVVVIVLIVIAIVHAVSAT